AGDIGERDGFSHAGASGGDVEPSRFEAAAKEPVEVSVSGGDDGRFAVGVEVGVRGGNLVVVGAAAGGGGNGGACEGAVAFLGDLVDVLAGVVGELANAQPSMVDSAAAGVACDDVGVVAAVLCCRDGVEEVVKVGAATDLGEVAVVGEDRADGDCVGGLAVVELVDDGVEDDGVRGLVEVGGGEPFGGVGDGVVIHEHGADDGLLGAQVGHGLVRVLVVHWCCLS